MACEYDTFFMDGIKIELKYSFNLSKNYFCCVYKFNLNILKHKYKNYVINCIIRLKLILN